MLMSHVDHYLAIRRAAGFALEPIEGYLRSFARFAQRGETRGRHHGDCPLSSLKRNRNGITGQTDPVSRFMAAKTRAIRFRLPEYFVANASAQSYIFSETDRTTASRGPSAWPVRPLRPIPQHLSDSPSPVCASQRREPSTAG